jgi:hypothetical protein
LVEWLAMIHPSVFRAGLTPAITLCILIAGCREEPSPSPDKRSSSVPAPASVAPAAVEPPAPPPEPSLDCDALILPEDIKEACGNAVTAAENQPKDDIGVERTCSRRWDNKDQGTISMLIVRHASVAEAKERWVATGSEIEAMPEYKALTSLGDSARRYNKKGVSGDPIYSVELMKGRFNVFVFNAKVTIGDTTVGPVCDLDNLEKLAAKVVSRVP